MAIFQLLYLSFNIVLVRKRDQTQRLCVDFRQPNRRMVKDELLEGVGGHWFYTVLYVKSAYHQIELEEDQKTYTAFIAGHLGFYVYNRLPFGLSNAPAKYKRLMESCLSDLIFDENRVCQIYLVDVIIASRTFEEHLHCLQKWFATFQESGLKLSPEKCKLFKSKLNMSDM